MRAVERPLTQVSVSAAGAPTRFVLDGRLRIVTELLDGWRYGGRWWLDEPPRDCYLVRTDALVAELHREDTPEGRWWLARVQD